MKLPDLSEMVALRGAARSLNLISRRPAQAHLQGSHTSAQRGRGLEFEEVRLYANGDDVRNIDWRVTARRGKMHTKLFREERERPVWLIVDLHAGLFFGSRLQLKSALLVRAAAVLAWAAAQGGDRVGAIMTNGEVAPRILQPRAREKGVLPILEALIEMQPQAPRMPAHGGLLQCLAMLTALIKPGSQVMVLSDFAGLDQSGMDLLSGMVPHSDFHLTWIRDALEASGLPNGKHLLGVPGKLRLIDGNQSRAAWKKAWQEREQRIRGFAGQLNIPLYELNTGVSVEESLKEARWAA